MNIPVLNSGSSFVMINSQRAIHNKDPCRVHNGVIMTTWSIQSVKLLGRLRLKGLYIHSYFMLSGRISRNIGKNIFRSYTGTTSENTDFHVLVA